MRGMDGGKFKGNYLSLMPGLCLEDRTIFVLYDCKTWSMTLMEEQRLKAFENKIIRGMFRVKRDENGGLRKLHNEEFNS